jgi:hypothetical protein
MALVIYLEYKCHEPEISGRLTGQQPAPGTLKFPIEFPLL